MKVYFRELTPEDVPAIKDISKDIWDGEDYIPYVIQEWLQDKNCLNYGTFTDKAKTDLIGFGRVKLYDKDVAWLEGGRIKVSLHGKGIGKKQLNYAIEYARQVGAKVAQYDTGSDNFASISLAKFFGFKRKKCMDLVNANINDLKTTKSNFLQVNELTAEEARELYKTHDIGPGNEICVGWSYIPFNYLTNKYGSSRSCSWISNKEAILQKFDFGQSHDFEQPSEQEIWIIVYGKPRAACELIQFTIQTELKSKESKRLEVFCKFDAVEDIKDLGFKYDEDKRFGVLLFEKILN
jgi:GNAT superfamily N-acetyltransferase